MRHSRHMASGDPPVELVVTSGALAGERIPVSGELTIGRRAPDGLSLNEDSRVSRRHARIRLENGLAPVIEDLGSGNGTFVNGTRIEAERLLEDGDVVVLGTTVFEISMPASLDERPHEPETISNTVVQFRRVATIDHSGNLITLGEGTDFVIGREPDCDVVVRSSEASRQHARIGQVEGRWMLTDLGSMNGTYLNGERLYNEPRWLTAGDTIVIAGETLTFDEATLPV